MVTAVDEVQIAVRISSKFSLQINTFVSVYEGKLNITGFLFLSGND